MTAARNGYFFVLDRVTGEHLVTSKYGSATNWVKAIDEKGAPERNPEKDAVDRRRRSCRRSAGGTINWEPPAFNPDTGLFYVAGEQRLLDLLPDRSRSARLDGPRRQARRSRVGTGGSFLTAIDYKTGKARWRHKYEGGAGGGGGVLDHRRRARVRRRRRRQHRRARRRHRQAAVALAHRQRHQPAADLLLDGRQYLLVAAGDTLYAFVMY